MSWSRSLPRTGLVLVAVALALVLIGSSIVRFRGARRAAAAVALVEGERLGRAVHTAMRRQPRHEDPTPSLDAALREQPGLIHVAVLDGDGRPLHQVGKPSPDAGRAPAGLPRFVDGLVVMEMGRPPPGAPPRPPDAPPALLLEFDVPDAEAVISAGWADLAVGITGGVGLLALALLAFYLDRRRVRLEADATRRAHLAQLGEMSAVLAHEIRNPLASLKGHAQLVEEQVDGHPAEASASRVVRAAERLERLVNNLLAFAKTGEINPRMVDPVQVAHDVLDRLAPDRIELLADDAPERWSLDPDATGRILENLLRNALQAGPDDAPVDLSVRGGGSLVFEVRDRGPGLPAGASIFEPFVTTRVRGTGLGLALSRRLAELQGGTLEGDDHPDGGAVLTLTLPSVTEG